MVCNVERLSLKLCVNTLGDRLIFHESRGPEKQAGTIERITPARAQTRSVQSIAIWNRTREGKAGGVDVVHVVGSNAGAVGYDAVGELECLGSQQTERVATDGRRERNTGANGEDVVETPIAKDRGGATTPVNIRKRSYSIRREHVTNVKISIGAIEPQIEGRETGNGIAKARARQCRRAFIDRV